MQASNDSFFVIRTPRLPFQNWFRIGQDKQKNRQVLLKWVSDKDVVESLYLASPSLIEQIEKWKKFPDIKHGEKVERTLLKYFIRMCTRSTPFGLFAGIQLGEIANQTSLVTAQETLKLRKTRLDMFFLSSVKEHLQQRTENFNLRYGINPSLYRLGHLWRYIEGYQSNNVRHYRLSEIEADEYLDFILITAKGELTIEQLVTAFMARFPEAESANVKDYIISLIEESVLVSSIPLPLTGESSHVAFIKTINKIEECDVSQTLNLAVEQLKQFDINKSAEIQDYKKLYASLAQLPVSVQENRLFQLDACHDFSRCELAQQDITRLFKNLKILLALSNKAQNPMLGFIKKFNDRFEGQRIQLSRLLDDETGISYSQETGYEGSLIAGINVAKVSSRPAANESVSKLDKIIYEQLSLPENRNKSIVKLNTKELSERVKNSSLVESLPASFGALISLFEDEDRNIITHLKTCYGPSAANLLGRFCHLDTQLKDKVVEHLRREEQSNENAVFAEVVHMPDGRPGNVIARPHLRKYEIVFMADSVLNKENQIGIEDLFVGVENNEVKLFSKRLGKRVIPRLSSAHNYTSNSLSIYKFLCLLQNQGAQTPNFTLPQALSYDSFTPRLMLDNVILSEKTWRIPRKELLAAFQGQSADEDRITNLKSKYRLDDYVCFSVADNELILDLKNSQMVDILLAETKGYDRVELRESLLTKYTTPVKSPSGDYFSNEIIVPFINPKSKSSETSFSTSTCTVNDVKRSFSPGSEWMSLKIYSGNAEVESLLLSQLPALLSECERLYENWFFIRYADPDWHLRLRFKGEPKTLYGQLLPKLHELLAPRLATGELHKIELFTYVREIGRYGGPTTIALAEQLFFADSRLVLQALSLIETCGEEVRWRTLALQTDRLLELFELTLDEKLQFTSWLREGFGAEFGESTQLRRELGSKFKLIEPVLSADLNHTKLGSNLEPDQIQDRLFSLVGHWEGCVTSHISKMKQLLNQVSAEGIHGVLASLIHMSNNRMFKAYSREQEFVMHDFMRRHYFSLSRRPNNSRDA